MLRPATPLTVLLFAAFAMLLLAVLSTPIIKAIPLGTYKGVNFGVFGWCDSNNKCSPIEIGYDTCMSISSILSYITESAVWAVVNTFLCSTAILRRGLGDLRSSRDNKDDSIRYPRRPPSCVFSHIGDAGARHRSSFSFPFSLVTLLVTTLHLRHHYVFSMPPRLLNRCPTFRPSHGLGFLYRLGRYNPCFP